LDIIKTETETEESPFSFTTDLYYLKKLLERNIVLLPFCTDLELLIYSESSFYWIQYYKVTPFKIILGCVALSDENQERVSKPWWRVEKIVHDISRTLVRKLKFSYSSFHSFFSIIVCQYSCFCKTT
jgi:hypothetical protein